jgi:predicted RNA-binding Zn-ribbon protein involved in translation (DUF1610 family)
MVWIIVSWWVSPELHPDTVGVEGAQGKAMLFNTREEAERWARQALQAGMWMAVEVPGGEATNILHCPACGTTFEVAEEVTGKPPFMVECPNCGWEVVVG